MRLPHSGLHHGRAAYRCARSTLCYTIFLVAREITQRELRNESGEIMRQLDEGETFIVTRNGVPVGELTPLRRHRFVAAETAVALFRTAPPVDYRQLRADLDAIADQGVAPRA
jgi:prevent-host-death family protein